jgi:hypothetical protein
VFARRSVRGRPRPRRRREVDAGEHVGVDPGRIHAVDAEAARRKDRAQRRRTREAATVVSR